MARTTPKTKQFALSSTPTHIGEGFEEFTSSVGVRIAIPTDATSAVWIGDKDVTTSNGGIYFPGTSTRLPSTSPVGWYALTDGAAVTISVEQASGGAAAPEWSDAGSAGVAGGGGGGGGATEAKQDAQIVQVATLISNTTGLALDATVVQVKEAIDALKGNGVDNATLYDLLFEMQTRGAIDTAHLENIAAATSDSSLTLDSLLASSEVIETYTDNVEPLLTDIKANQTNGTQVVSANLRVASNPVSNENPVPVVYQNFATFNVIALATALANGKALISVMFAGGGSATKLRLLDVQIMNVQTANVTGTLADIQLRRITAHAGGTEITNLVTKYDTLDTLGTGITVRTGATPVTSEANPLRKWLLATDEYAIGSLETEGFQASLENTFPNFFFDPRTRPLVARVGEGFQILCNTVAAGTFDVGLTFAQE